MLLGRVALDNFTEMCGAQKLFCMKIPGKEILYAKEGNKVKGINYIFSNYHVDSFAGRVLYND